MRAVQPQVYVVARTVPSVLGMAAYLRDAGGSEWMRTRDRHGQQDLVEFAGRLCYRSWEPGLNPNVTAVRADQDAYLRNILASGHGSVLEHASYSFVFRDVSRVFTHELVRHRPGIAVSQESLRYVRLDELPMWLPEQALAGDEEARQQVGAFLERAEWLQQWLAGRLGLDGLPFAAKKRLTSFMRRLAPGGVATSVMWTANLRALRHVIEARTSPAAEEEIRLVFGEVARVMTSELPAIFGDFADDGNGTWAPRYRKV